MSTNDKAQPPALSDNGGFDLGDRLIQGIIIKWDAEQGWHDRDGLDVPSPLIVLATTTAIQRFQNKQLIETITTRPLPNIADLNASVPVNEWEPDLTGRPRPPYALFYVLYLLNEIDAQMFTYLNSTTGAEIAIQRLSSRICNMRLLRGAKVNPVVTLGEGPMKTKFGTKLRPELIITDWRTFGGGTSIQGPAPVPQLTSGASVVPETTPKPEPAPEPVRTKRGVVKNTKPKPAVVKTAELPRDDLNNI
jgi:hypothetical protein